MLKHRHRPAVWSLEWTAPLVLLHRKCNPSSSVIRNFEPLAIFCGCTCTACFCRKQQNTGFQYLNPLVTNGISHPYHLDDIGSSGAVFYFISFFDEIHESKQNGCRWNAMLCCVTFVTLRVLMSHKKDPGLINPPRVLIQGFLQLVIHLMFLCGLICLNTQ